MHSVTCHIDYGRLDWKYNTVFYSYKLNDGHDYQTQCTKFNIKNAHGLTNLAGIE